jgi:hypothetical protein
VIVVAATVSAVALHCVACEHSFTVGLGRDAADLWVDQAPLAAVAASSRRVSTFGGLQAM